MSFSDRSEFIAAQASEKVTLAHVTSTTRLFTFTVHAGNVYKRQTDYFVTAVREGNTALTKAGNLPSVGVGMWFYDVETSTLYVNTSTSVDPADLELIVDYRLFFATRNVVASWDLSDTGAHVHYEGRIKRSPGYKHKVGVDQKLTSVIGNGSLRLENNDTALDEIYDTLVFENKKITIYSWNPQIAFSEARVIYRGRVSNKTYDGTTVGLKIKDELFDLKQPLPQSAYTDDDNVNTNIKGRYKRWVYGRVDGLQLQSVDQIGEGYDLTGTVSGTADGATVTGSGTTFLSELSPDDTLIIGTQEFTVETVDSDTSLTLDATPDFAFTASTAQVVPDIPTTSNNREFFVAGHASAKVTKTVINALQFNRIELNSTTGLVAGDFITFQGTGERIEIKNVAPGNIIVLRKNVVTKPAVSSLAIREPIQKLYIAGQLVFSDDFTITNVGSPTNETKVTIDTDTEFNLARKTSLGVSLTWTNGSRDVTTAAAVDLREIVSPRDWIRPTDISFTTYYEVLSVDEQAMELRIVFADPNHTGATDIKRPNYVGDDTIVSADVLGRTADGEPAGTWIQTAADAVKDILSELNITDINTTSFTDAAVDASHLISAAFPLSVSGALTPAKTAIDLINKSVNGALTLDNDLLLQYRILNLIVPDDLITIKDTEVITWGIKASNNDVARNAVFRYRHTDVQRSTQETGSNVIEFSSEFVEKYIGTNDTVEKDVYLYEENSSEIMAHREIFHRALGRADISVTTDLRLEDVEIGDSVIVDFERLYKRFGDSASRKKICMVVGKKVNGSEVKLDLTDRGNTFNRSSIITPNTASPWTSATEDEKLKYGYITASNGIVNSEEETNQINLIS